MATTFTIQQLQDLAGFAESLGALTELIKTKDYEKFVEGFAELKTAAADKKQAAKDKADAQEIKNANDDYSVKLDARTEKLDAREDKIKQVEKNNKEAATNLADSQKELDDLIAQNIIALQDSLDAAADAKQSKIEADAQTNLYKGKVEELEKSITSYNDQIKLLKTVAVNKAE